VRANGNWCNSFTSITSNSADMEIFSRCIVCDLLGIGIGVICADSGAGSHIHIISSIREGTLSDVSEAGIDPSVFGHSLSIVVDNTDRSASCGR